MKRFIKFIKTGFLWGKLHIAKEIFTDITDDEEQHGYVAYRMYRLFWIRYFSFIDLYEDMDELINNLPNEKGITDKILIISLTN